VGSLKPFKACGGIRRRAEKREEIRRLRQENFELRRRANELATNAQRATIRSSGRGRAAA
jgi:hypothetical protein